MTEYTAKERASYRTPSCPACGSRITHSWQETTGLSDEIRRWIPKDLKCINAKCENHYPSLTGIPGL